MNLKCARNLVRKQTQVDGCPHYQPTLLVVHYYVLQYCIRLPAGVISGIYYNILHYSTATSRRCLWWYTMIYYNTVRPPAGVICGGILWYTTIQYNYQPMLSAVYMLWYTTMDDHQQALSVVHYDILHYITATSRCHLHCTMIYYNTVRLPAKTLPVYSKLWHTIIWYGYQPTLSVVYNDILQHSTATSRHQL